MFINMSVFIRNNNIITIAEKHNIMHDSYIVLYYIAFCGKTFMTHYGTWTIPITFQLAMINVYSVIDQIILRARMLKSTNTTYRLDLR